MHLKDLRSLKGTPKYMPPEHKDYNEDELYNIEGIFLRSFNYGKTDGKNKEAQFNGLMAVIDYLAELDNIKVPSIKIEQFKEVLNNC